jgi:propionate CoA-transferase
MTRFVRLDEALDRIPDGATVATNGFTLMGVAEAVVAGIEERFLATGHPRDLIVVHAAGQSNREVGFEHFANTGLVRRVVGSHWVKGANTRVASLLGDCWEDLRHGLLLSVPLVQGSSWGACSESPRAGLEGR